MKIKPFYPVPKTKILLFFFLCTVSLPTFSAIYRWVDSQGVAHFTDKPPESVKAERVRSKVEYGKPMVIKREEIKEANSGGIRRVILYSAPGCSVCEEARDYFIKSGITFTEYNIDKNPEGAREFKRMNAQGVPVVLYGSARMNGFGIKAFERIYNKKQ